MALDNAAIDELAEQLREAARQQRAAVRPDIQKSYNDLVSLPPRERAAERQRRVNSMMDYIHRNVPAQEADNAKVAMGMLRDSLGQLLDGKVAVDEITDDQLSRLVMKWRQGVQEDTEAEAREIMEQAGMTPPGAHTHTKRPHISI